MQIYRTSVLTLTLLALAACKGSSSSASAAPVADTPAAIAPKGATAPEGATAPAASASPTAPKASPNQGGRIPVLEYHVIAGEKDGLYTRVPAHYLADLETAYKLGYRPITIAQMLDKNFSDVPAGMSPVVVVFDDASPSQFRYIEKNGALQIDPTSGVGIWLSFAKSHPGWKNRATFCVLNGAAAGHNFFGDSPKFEGQKKEWRFQKIKWLADNGFELCDHTVWHARLDKFSDAIVQEQIARNIMAIDSAVPGYKVRTLALPYGIWPKNRPLAWQGTWTDPKTHQAHPYHLEAVLEVSGGPARSPYDPAFNPHSITRIEAIGDDIQKALNRLASTNTRFVVK
ncbi:MAG: polysaccharide deacetylase family protein [Gemmatimonadaceae bacterium]|nr:polysaccharide deacetylase family protein [Gemmatimonadaceae bacterium]